MTGIGTQLALAEIALRHWRDTGTADVADSELPYFRLGAIAGNLSEFLGSRPDDPNGRGAAPVFGVWQPVLSLLADSRDAAGTVVPGVASNFASLKTVLEKYRVALGNQDKWALLDLLPELQALSDTVATLQTQLASVQTLRTQVGLAAIGVRPKPKEESVADWHLRDVAHGHSTGRFWGELSRRAIDSGDVRLRAFGLGVAVAYAGTLAGDPFANGVVGGPYRNHWWRHHWVRNHIDTWAWGYQATREDERSQGREIVFEVGDTAPNPNLAAWRNLAGGDVQNLFAIGGVDPASILSSVTDSTAFPSFLPPEIAQLWVDVHADVIDDPALSNLDAQAVQSAYAMAWLTTWLSSSGAVLGSVPPDRINEPDACGDRPAWAAPDGSVLFGGTVTSPPTPSAPSPSAAEIASAIVAAILAIVAFATGNIGAGIGLLAAGVAIIDNATDPDWDELRCHLGWVDVYLQSLENALRDMLVAAGLAHPFAVSLRHNPASFALAGVAEPFGAALNTCRPRADRGYPRSVWNPLAGGTFQSSWLAYPVEPTENPTTRAYVAGTWWPSHFLDGFTFSRVVAADGTVSYTAAQTNPLGVDPGGRPFVLAGDVWDEHRTITSDGGSPDRTFGNATDIATALVQQGDGAWLDWDLDGDRGLSWPTWMHVPGGSPSAITPE